MTRESRGAYHAFCHFRDLPPGVRSLEQAFRAHRELCLKKPGEGAQSPGRWRRWRRHHQWDARAGSFDASNEEKTRREHLEGIRLMNERHVAIATAVQARVVERLQAIDVSRLGPVALIAWFEKASQIERRARGVPTEHVMHSDQFERYDYSQLSVEELEQLRTLLEKAIAKSEGDRQ
jgi:hypothetical protein